MRDTPQFLPGKKLEISNGLIAEMNGRLGALCGEMGVPYLDILTPLGEDEAWRAVMVNGDGVHPTADGYDIIARLIAAHAGWQGLIGNN